jgi:general secretion pathway protein C
MLARLSAFVIWALIAATAVFWVLRLAVRAPAAPPHGVAVGEVAAGGDLTRLLGAPPAAEAAPVAAGAGSQYRGFGCSASWRRSRLALTAKAPGVALIAVDGKPPRAFAVGAHLDGDLVLQSVSLRTVSIGSTQGSPPVVLEIPRLPPAATGSLPAFGSPHTSAPAPAPAAAPPFPGAPGGIPSGPGDARQPADAIALQRR